MIVKWPHKIIESKVLKKGIHGIFKEEFLKTRMFKFFRVRKIPVE